MLIVYAQFARVWSEIGTQRRTVDAVRKFNNYGIVTRVFRKLFINCTSFTINLCILSYICVEYNPLDIVVKVVND